jgi:hypothetical protein
VPDSCEHSNERSGTIKGGGFLDQLNNLPSQEEFRSMQLAA